MAERIAKVVFEHNGDVWFQEPVYNFGFFATAAQMLKYPLLKASELSELRSRITSLVQEIQEHPTVSDVHSKKTKGDKNDGSEKGRRAPETSPDSQPVGSWPSSANRTTVAKSRFNLPSLRPEPRSVRTAFTHSAN